MDTAADNRLNDVYERARLARDSRYDGRFFIGVRTTGIYCRPVCPANPPRRENVRFFATAAAASEAGYRPCLRCRPETAPGSPAWAGTSTTVRRGLRLIASGALEKAGIEALAERLGVTSRHLRRLFTRHVGASPLAVAQTQRLHFAKRLIDETALPMGAIAAAAGYGSTRRYNDAFRKAYGRAPRELRRLRSAPDSNGAAAGLTLRLPYREPMDWPKLRAWFAVRGTPGVEALDGDTYRRAIALGEDRGLLTLRPGNGGFISMTVEGIPTSGLFEVVQRVREMLDLDAPVDDIGRAFAADPVLAPLVAANPGVRVPGCWDGFELAVRAILGQQVSVAAATTLAGRIAARYGEHLAVGDEMPATIFPGPARLARARFARIGLVSSRAATLRALSRAVLAGDVSFDPGQDPDDFRRALTAIKGIGDWTAAYVAMRALKDPDAFPAADLGLRKAFDGEKPLATTTLETRARAWRPWRAYAAMLLWQSLPGTGG